MTISAKGRVVVAVISAEYNSILEEMSCGASLRRLSAFRDMAITRSIPHFSSPPRLKQSRMDLPKKPVPPMTRSVDKLYYFIFSCRCIYLEVGRLQFLYAEF